MDIVLEAEPEEKFPLDCLPLPLLRKEVFTEEESIDGVEEWGREMGGGSQSGSSPSFDSCSSRENSDG